MTIPKRFIPRATLTLATVLFLLIGSKYVMAPASAAGDVFLAADRRCAEHAFVESGELRHIGGYDMGYRQGDHWG